MAARFHAEMSVKGAATVFAQEPGADGARCTSRERVKREAPAMAEQDPRQVQKEMMSAAKARQGTGSGGMSTVLILSTVLAAVGTAFLAYFLA